MVPDWLPILDGVFYGIYVSWFARRPGQKLKCTTSFGDAWYNYNLFWFTTILVVAGCFRWFWSHLIPPLVISIAILAFWLFLGCFLFYKSISSCIYIFWRIGLCFFLFLQVLWGTKKLGSAGLGTHSAHRWIWRWSSCWWESASTES